MNKLVCDPPLNTGPKNTSCKIDGLELSPGQHTFEVITWDSKGNKKSDMVNFTVAAPKTPDTAVVVEPTPEPNPAQSEVSSVGLIVVIAIIAVIIVGYVFIRKALRK